MDQITILGPAAATRFLESGLVGWIEAEWSVHVNDPFYRPVSSLRPSSRGAARGTFRL